MQDNFLDGTSSSYLEELEERFRADPTSVDKTWASFFTNLGAAAELTAPLPRLNGFDGEYVKIEVKRES